MTGSREWKPMMPLQHKVAIVTGGAVRLGRAIVDRLVQRGFRVLLHFDHSETEAQQAVQDHGEAVCAVQANFCEPLQAANRLFDRAREEFGAVDVLINNAAIFEDQPLDGVDESAWDRHFSINLKAPFFLSQAFSRQHVAGHVAQIVNIADWRGTKPGTDHLVYTLTKSALITMTQNLAQVLAPEIRVNAIAPGAILPPPGVDQRAFQQQAATDLLQAPGSPEDVLQALDFLLQSHYITGDTLYVAGGHQL